MWGVCGAVIRRDKRAGTRSGGGLEVWPHVSQRGEDNLLGCGTDSQAEPERVDWSEFSGLEQAEDQWGEEPGLKRQCGRRGTNGTPPPPDCLL